MESKDALKKNKIIISAVVIVLLFLAGLTFCLVSPLVSRVKNAKNELDMSKLTLESMQSDASKLDKYQKLETELIQNKEMIDKALIKEETVVSFIEQLEKIADDSANSITIEQFIPPKKKKVAAQNEEGAAGESGSSGSTGQKKEEPKNLSYLMLTLEGNYKGLLRYIYLLENSGYAFDINSFDSNLNTKALIRTTDVVAQAENLQNKNIQTKILISFELQK